MNFKCVPNDLQNAIDIPGHIIVPESKHQITHCFQNFRSLFVVARANSMLSAVEFDNEMRISAEEIDDETIKRKLPTKFPSAQAAIAQPEPQNPFGICLITT